MIYEDIIQAAWSCGQSGYNASTTAQRVRLERVYTISEFTASNDKLSWQSAVGTLSNTFDIKNTGTYKATFSVYANDASNGGTAEWIMEPRLDGLPICELRVRSYSDGAFNETVSKDNYMYFFFFEVTKENSIFDLTHRTASSTGSMFPNLGGWISFHLMK